MANMQGAPSSQDEQKSALEQYGVNLTAIAQTGKLDPVIGRDAEIRRITQVLTRRTKNNPVLIGEPGVGKPLSSRASHSALSLVTFPTVSRASKSSRSTSRLSSRGPSFAASLRNASRQC